MKTSSFSIDYIDYREIAEILAKFGGVASSVMIIYKIVFIRLLKRMFKKHLKKLHDTKDDDDLPKNIIERVSYSGINSLFNRFEKENTKLENMDTKMEDHKTLLGNHKTQLSDLSTKVNDYRSEHDSQINQLKTTLDTVFNEL